MEIANNDTYELAVSIVADDSAAGLSKSQASINNMAKQLHATVETQLVASKHAESDFQQAIGQRVRTWKIKVPVEFDYSKAQQVAQRQMSKVQGVKIDVQPMTSSVQNAVNEAVEGVKVKPVVIPVQVTTSADGSASYGGTSSSGSGSFSSGTTYWEKASAGAKAYQSNLIDVVREQQEATSSFSSLGAAMEESRSSVDQVVSGLQREGNAAEDSANKMHDHAQAESDSAKATESNAVATTGMIGRLATYAFSMRHIIRYLREMVNITIELNDAMTQLKIVTRATDEEYAKYASNIARTATEIGIATKDLIDASTVYARLGYNLEQSSALAKYTGMLQNVGDIDATTAQNAITSIVKAFNIDIENIESVMDKLVVVGNNFPISVSQIAQGMMNASSSLHAAGNDINQSIALLTAANTTAQDISKASTGMRTIAARLRNTKAELDELGEEVMTEAKYQELVDMITKQGVSLIDEQTGDLRSTYEVLKDLAAIWEKIGVNEKAALATQIAGVRQQNIFYSVIEQFKEAEDAMDAMAVSAGTLDDAYAIYMESITAHINQFKAAWQSLSQSVMDSGIITGIIDIGTAITRLIDGFIKITKEIKVFIPLVAAIPLASILAHIEGIGKFLGGTALVKGISNLFTLIKNFRLLGDAIKGVETATKALGGAAGIASGVLTALGLIATAIVATKAIYDKLNVTLDERVERIGELEANITDLENKLANVRDRIAEIKSLGPLKITEAEELANLQAEQTVLEARLVVQEKLLATQKELAHYQARSEATDLIDAGTVAEDIEKYRKAQENMDNVAHQRYEYIIAETRRIADLKKAYEAQREILSNGGTLYEPYIDYETQIAAPERALKAYQEAYDIDIEHYGKKVGEAIQGLSDDFDTIQTYINQLDPTRAGDLIRDLRTLQIQILDEMDKGDVGLGGSRLSSSSSMWTLLLGEDTKKRVAEVASGLKDGVEGIGEEIKKLYTSADIQKLKTLLNNLGIDFDLGILFSWLRTMGEVATSTNEMSGATESARTSLTGLLDAVRSVNGQLTQLKSVYDTIQDGFASGTVDWSSIIGDSDFANAFGDLDSYEEFMRIILTMPDDLDACSDAYKAMAKEALLSSEAAKTWTDQTKAAAEAILEEKGYIDSTDLSTLAAQQDASARAAEKHADATLDETIQMRDAAAAGSMERQALAELAFTKAAVNRTAISTVADIDQLIALANAANATTQSLLALEAAKGAKQAQVDAADALLSGDITTYKVKLRQSTSGGQTAEQKLASAIKNIKFDYGSILENYNTSVSTGLGGGGGGSGSSVKEVEEYIASIDKYYAALKRLESAKLAMADANRRLEDSEDLNEKIRITKEIIDLYSAQSAATAELIALRKETIQTEVEGLRALGFQIQYNAETNEFYVANLAHINELTAESVGAYDSLEEATNALRQETEDLIESLDSLNKENQEGIENLHELSQSAKEARQSIVDFYDEIVKEANSVVDGFQNVYKVLTDAAKEYAQTGYLSVDSLQAILDLGPKYLAMLMDENGQLVINEQNLQAVIAAKTQDMAAETALSYAKQVLLATERGEEDVLRNLTDATAASSAATWDLAFATVGLAKAIGTANGMSEEYYDNAVSYLTSMQSLTETAVNSIPQYYETLKSSYISQADALDQVLKLTQDMLKWENQQAIDALEKQKDAYADIINQKKELIKLTKEEQDHEKDLAEKIAEIAKLQARINQLSLDDSREAQAQKRKLEEELAKLQKSLADDQAEYSVDVQNDALDAQLEMYENEKDDEIAALEDSLNSAEKLYQAALHELETDYGGTIERLKEWNYEVGNTLQQSLLDAIDAATAALDRFGGSFTAALEGVEGYTNLGTNNTSGASTASSANDIISAMRRNSITWWTTPNQSIEELNAQQASLAKQYSQISGDQIYKDANGTWHHASGDILYSLTAAEKDQIAHNIVAKMKANSAAWFSADDATKKALSEETLELGKRFGWLTGKTPTRDANGTWWLDGKKLYDIYHAGGIVGGGSFKQNEIMALLEKGEAVLDAQKEQAVYKAVDFISALSDRIGSSINASDISRIFGSVSPAAAGGNYASLIRNGAAMAGGLLGGCNIERIDVVAPIQVVQKLDREEIQAHAEMIGAVSAQYIKDGFTKRGIQVGASWY